MSGPLWIQVGPGSFGPLGPLRPRCIERSGESAGGTASAAKASTAITDVGASRARAARPGRRVLRPCGPSAGLTDDGSPDALPQDLRREDTDIGGFAEPDLHPPARGGNAEVELALDAAVGDPLAPERKRGAELLAPDGRIKEREDHIGAEAGTDREDLGVKVEGGVLPARGLRREPEEHGERGQGPASLGRGEQSDEM